MIQDNFANSMDRKPLFPGESCRLLSPDFANGDDKLQEYSEKDQKND